MGYITIMYFNDYTKYNSSNGSYYVFCLFFVGVDLYTGPCLETRDGDGGRGC